MDHSSIARKVLKWVSWSALGLLVLPVIVALLILLPPVQGMLTNQISHILSEKIQTEVSIEAIRLSLWDGIAIDGFQINDPHGSELLKTERIGIMPVVGGLLTGQLDFHYVGLSGFQGKLINGSQGLNIQFIIDAFSTKETIEPDPKPFSLFIDQLQLENIRFEFHSETDSLDLKLYLSRFEVIDLLFSTTPDKIESDQITVSELSLDILSRALAEKTGTDSLILLDFGAGFDIDINNIELKDNQISYQVGSIAAPDKFSPDHISLDSLQLHLSGLSLKEDTLQANIETMAGNLFELPVFGLRGNLEAGLYNSTIRELELLLGKSMMKLDLALEYGSWQNLPNEIRDVRIKTQLTGDIFHGDLSYLLPDSILNLVDSWPHTQLELFAEYRPDTIFLQQAIIDAGQSQLSAQGILSGFNSIDSMAWQQLEISSVIDKEFLTLLTPVVGLEELPGKMKLELSSDGHAGSFSLRAGLRSGDGNIDIAGHAGVSSDQVDLDNLTIAGQKVEAGKLLAMPWLGMVDFSTTLNGSVGAQTDLAFNGSVDRVYINKHPLIDTKINGRYGKETAELMVDILDPQYRLSLASELSLGEQIEANTSIDLNDFGIGTFVGQDTSLLLTTSIRTDLTTGPQMLDLDLTCFGTRFSSNSIKYPLDTLSLNALISTQKSEILLLSKNLQGNLSANFHLEEANQLINEIRSNNNIKDKNDSSDRRLQFNLQLTADQPLKMLSSDIEKASDINLSGLIDESNQVFNIHANTGSFQGFGLAIDTLVTDIERIGDKILADLSIESISLDSLSLGDLSFMAHSRDTGQVYSRFSLISDSVALLKFSAEVHPDKDLLRVSFDSLQWLGQELSVNSQSPVVLTSDNISFDRFEISGEKLRADINGDIHEFELTIENADLTRLNLLIPADSDIIHHGRLDGLLAFVKADQKIHLQATVDSLTFKDSPAVNVTARAVTEGDHIPFSLNFNSITNNIGLTGDYTLGDAQVAAKLTLDIDQLKMFDFLVAKTMESMEGKVSGQVDIAGKLTAPEFQGEIVFHDVALTTLKPRSSFFIKDEVLSLNNSGLMLRDFTVYDPLQNALKLNGDLKTEDYQNFEYDLSIETDNYMLVNNPREEDYQLQGNLVIGSNLKIAGTERDTKIEASVTVKDTTNLTYVLPPDNLELLSSEGIVEFIDPNEATDSLKITQTQTFYDSLIAAFPEFNLQAEIKLEEQAVLQVMVDARSGDFIEASGAADLNLDIDRSGNVILEGSYTITRGFYQLSFYDMVKKRFDIVAGSSIRWTGDPDTGVLNFKATHKINSASVGLIGHEIADNEREIYRKALPYEVGIVITGTLDAPVISFDLDLPEQDKRSYPVLANKLDRLKQPEFESELNKQVFGLLVLGGFIPESSTSEFDQSLIATTALSNSVNSILASQLNRFAGQLVKGVDINVAMQSYSDYASSGGGGQTRTTMDFRLTKRMMDDRLSIEVGGGVDINSDQSGAPAGSDNFRGDITVIYDLTESGDKQIKLFNNETYDIIYHEIRNTGISLIFIRDFDKNEKSSNR